MRTALGTGRRLTHVSEVVAAGESERGIQRLRLRPELKQVEESLTNFLSECNVHTDAIVNFLLEKRDITQMDIETVKDRYRRFAKRKGILAVLKCFFHEDSEFSAAVK